MSSCLTRKFRLAPTAIGLLAAWLTLPGCGSDSETKTVDAAIHVATDVAGTVDLGTPASDVAGADTSQTDAAQPSPSDSLALSATGSSPRTSPTLTAPRNLPSMRSCPLRSSCQPSPTI